MSSLTSYWLASLAAALATVGGGPPEDAVSVRRLEPTQVLVLPMKGSHAQHDAAFARLAAELRAQGIVPTGAAFGRYWNDRRSVPEADLQWEIGVPVARTPDVAAPFVVKEIPGGDTAILVHEGAYASSAAGWPVMLEWLASHHYRPAGPAMQIYLGNPNLSGALGPRTELRLPVEGIAVPRTSSAPPPALDGRWAASQDLRIVVHGPGSSERVLTDGHKDFKPSWSPDGTRLTFFRLVASGPEFKDWRTRICVVNVDGSGLRELTDGSHADFNPTWTRDGSSQIVFNRYSPQGGWRNRVYATRPSASPGDEQMLSDPAYPHFEWVTGALRDGRLVVDRVSSSTAETFLLRPDPGRAGRYERLTRPTDQVWHKLTVSPSETRVAYMLDFDRNSATYEDVVLCYADLDLERLTISNQVAITSTAPNAIHEYPAWSRDERLVYYDSNLLGRYQLFAYRLADGVTERVSPRADRDDQFVALEGLPR